MTTEEISEILKLHKAWINGEKHGKRADLSGAYLSGAGHAIYAYGMPG